MKEETKEVKWLAAYATALEKKRMQKIAKQSGLSLRAYAIKRIRVTEAYGTEGARMFALLHDIRRQLIEDYRIISLYCSGTDGSVTPEEADKAADEYCELADTLVTAAGTIRDWYAPAMAKKGA